MVFPLIPLTVKCAVCKFKPKPLATFCHVLHAFETSQKPLFPNPKGTSSPTITATQKIKKRENRGLDRSGGMADDSSSGKRKRNGDHSSDTSPSDHHFFHNFFTTSRDHAQINSIYINTCTGKTFSLEVQPTDTIGDIKFKIRAKEEIPVDQQALIFNKMVLDDTNTIRDFDIQNSSTLKLMRISRGFTRIFIKIPKLWTTISIEAKPSDTISNLKTEIWDQQGIPHEEQVLIFDKMVLADSGSLVDFNIKKDSTLKLMFKSRGSMKIFVKNLTTTHTATGTVITLMVKPTDTIRNVKNEIKFKVRVPCDEQVLIFNQMVLDDSSTLADLQISMKSTLTLMRRSTGFMKIYVRMHDGNTIAMEVKPTDTIDSLKVKIRETEGIPSCNQILRFDGKQLQGGCTLADYNISEESTLDFMLMQRGS